MRSFLIDEVSRSDMEKIHSYLKENAVPSKMDSLFWVRLPDDLLSPIQSDHRECAPHVFAVELGSDWVKLEFFIRSLNVMQCTCPGYCTPRQMDFVIKYGRVMIDRLDLST